MTDRAAATPPTPPRRVETRSYHDGRFTIEDPYAWMRPPGAMAYLKDPSVIPAAMMEHLKAENAFTETWMAANANLRETLVAEMRGRIAEDDDSVPLKDGAFEYWRRFEAGRDYPIFVRRPVAGGPEQVVLDANAEAAEAPFFSLGSLDRSPDQRLLAWCADLSGHEFYTLHMRDIETGRDLERIENVRPGVAWDAAGETVTYVPLDADHKTRRVLRHRLGTSVSDDVVVFEGDGESFLSADATASRALILISAHTHGSDEIRLLKADGQDSAPVLVRPREDGVRYEVEHDAPRDRLVIRTDLDAEDYRICTADPASPGDWSDLVPHRPGRYIGGLSLFRRHMVRREVVDCVPRQVITNLETGDERVVTWDEPLYDMTTAGAPEYETTTARFHASSPRRPDHAVDLDLETGAQTVRKVQVIPSGHDPEAYVVDLDWATAPDGERVPVTLLRHRDTVPENAPVLLYGYGAYGITDTDDFRAGPLSLVDRGAIWAVAHIRGGRKRGGTWYRHGKLEHKANTFTDFIAVADHLVARGLTQPGRIVAMGGSAGGMLMGAVANRRPDLFAGILAIVPFVDVLNTMLSPDLPLTPPEWSEWGNPVEDAEAFQRMRDYSPYDTVRPQAYPDMLVTAGLFDPRVTFWEPAKWVARLRETATNSPTILLHTEMEAGHGGKSGRFKALEERAMLWAFALERLGLADARPRR
ncbi:S9 family peptidase [Caenispirillum salinarum]|uniref:S9 family peptidase n=1 Tax=Caenispirillum salinarum TaxID=859058 RepID=UPI0038504A23